MSEVREREALPEGILAWRKRLEAGLDPHAVIATASRIYEAARWSSTARLRGLCKDLCQQMLVEGFDEACVLELPSDGVMHHGGWAMPVKWSPRSAILEITDASGAMVCRGDYAECPHHLVLFSAPTPTEGLTGELVLMPDGEDLGCVYDCFVLMQTAPSIEQSERLMRAGALGFVTDFVSRIPGVKDGPALQDAVPYLNYSIAPWAIPEAERAVGFAISPGQGSSLREKIRTGGQLTVCARVAVDLGPGSMPVVMGHVSGKSGRDIFLTAHIDEPGAVDNASGPAIILEVVRCLRRMKQRDGEALEHGIRVFFSVEVRGLQALVNGQPELFQGGLCGLNIDMIGTNPDESRCSMLVSPSYPGCPDFVYPLLARMFDTLAEEQENFCWETRLMVDDNNTSDPVLKIPMPVIVQGPDATYHTSLDTPERLVPEWITRLGAAVGAIVAVLADADDRLIEELLRLNARFSRDCLADALPRLKAHAEDDAIAQYRYLIDRECRRLAAILKLTNSPSPPVPFVTHFRPMDSRRLAEMNGSGRLKSLLCGLCDTIRTHGNAGLEEHQPDPTIRPSEEVDRFVPMKAFCGHFATDNLPPDQAAAIEAAAGAIGWCAPNWLQSALGLADGTRSVREIHSALCAEELEVELPALLETFRALEAGMFVKSIHFIDTDELQSAFRRAGVEEGMLVVLHSSLSRFGYISGGAEGLLRALLPVLGGSGTLCAPTHTLSWAGNPPYDPDETPSIVGAVTNTFRQLPGTLRSRHPTHSVAAHGPLAESLLCGHDRTCSPLGRSGFWGHFVENDGWVLLMSPRSTNTLMHTAEIWGGVREPDVYLPATGDAPMEVLPQIPWHVDWFEDIYAVLDADGLIRSASVGRGTIELMRARDVVEIGLELIRDNPARICPKSCDCQWCQQMRQANGWTRD